MRKPTIGAALLITTAFAFGAFAANPPSRRQLHRDPDRRALGQETTAAPRAATNAFGGYMPYHNENTLRCADCHVIHASQQHAYDGTIAGYPVTTPAYDKLLWKADSIDVCLACHDGMLNVPDVVNDDANTLTERSAGFFDLPDEPNHRGHNLGRGIDPDPNRMCDRCHFVGEFAAAKVTCIDCHNPHGNNRVRNLQWPSAPGLEPQFGMIHNPAVTGVAKYERGNVAHTYVPGTAREASNMCIDCHHAFFDDADHWYTNPDGNLHWNRHPGFNSEWGATDPIAAGADTGSSNPAHWLGGTGSGFVGLQRVRFLAIGAADFNGAQVVDPQTNAVFCLTCHKAHGSENGFAMTWDPHALPRPKGCDQCHAVMEP